MEADMIEEEEDFGVLEDCFESLDKLISEGIDPGDVKKLQDAGIFNCYSLVMHTTNKSRKEIKGLPEAKVNKIGEAAQKHLQACGFPAMKESFDSIGKLISEGISTEDVKKLQGAGIHTLNALMEYKKKSLTGIKGLSEAKVVKICEAAQKLLGQAISAQCAAKMHDMPLVGAGAVPRTGGSQCWSLLHRVVFFVHPVAVDLDGVNQEGQHFGQDEGLTEPSPIPPGVEFCINHGPLVDASQLPDGALREMIPDISMVILNCSLLSASSANTISGLVKCTDSSGNILIEVSQGPGTECLLVCQPGNGTARTLPPVPGLLGVQTSRPCIAGTAYCPSASKEDFIVVQLVQSASCSSSSSHSPKAMHALCFTSSDDSWTLNQLRGGQVSNFKADAVFSHNNASIIFVDQEYGLLIFDIMKQDTTIVRFPDNADFAEGSGTETISIRRYVGSSEGHLWHVLVHDLQSTPKVSVWLLDESYQEGHWKHKFCINMDEIWNCSDYKNLSLPVGLADVAFIHPMNSNKVFFVLHDDVTVCFSAEVLPSAHNGLYTVHCEVFTNCRASPLDMHPFEFPDPDRCPTGSAAWHTLLLKAIKGSKSLVKFGWRTLKKNKKLLERAPAAVEFIGWGIGSPYPIMPFLRTSAEVISKIGVAMDIEETVSNWFISPRASSLDCHVVGTRKEANEAIERWNSEGKPANMIVLLAHGLSDDEKCGIIDVFTRKNSEDLLFLSGWEVI